MASKKEATVTFTQASPVNPSCLGWCLRSYKCRSTALENVDVANLEPLLGSELYINKSTKVQNARR